MAPDDWQPEIQPARERADIRDPCEYPDEVVLAFIEVESGGDPYAHRPGSQFHGLTQAGKYAAIDVGLPDSTSLHGDGPLAIEVLLRYLDRYYEYHDYDYLRMSVVWKGGPGTAKLVEQRLDAGIDFRRALRFAEQTKNIPNLEKYVRRFQRALERRLAE